MASAGQLVLWTGLAPEGNVDLTWQGIVTECPACRSCDVQVKMETWIMRQTGVARDRILRPVCYCQNKPHCRVSKWVPSNEELWNLLEQGLAEENASIIEAEWTKYEAAKKCDAEARRRARQQSPVCEDEPVQVIGPMLTGYDAYRARLLAGETLGWCSSGNSLAPLKIKNRDHCTYTPVTKDEDINEKDVVFCQIGSTYWEHMVRSKRWHAGRNMYIYTISNGHGYENGDTTLEKIYGR